MRPPTIPLVVQDPYFSVWMPADRLTDRDAVHWTGRANLMRGTARIDGKDYRWLGRGPGEALEQTGLEVGALSTVATFRAGGVEFVATFTSPLLPDDLDRLSTPISFVELRANSLDGRRHAVEASLAVSEQFCLDHEGDSPVDVKDEILPGGLADISMGSTAPRPLEREGDNLRIEWGRVHLAAFGAKLRSFREEGVAFATHSPDDHDGASIQEAVAGMSFIAADVDISDLPANVLVGYDDSGASVELFGAKCPAWWQRDAANSWRQRLGDTAGSLPELAERCKAFSARVESDARAAGGGDYAALLALAYRQAVGAHKLVADDSGKPVFISKENFSNGCAATVDVSYPSVPLFLLYAPELVPAMLRPIFRLASSPAWPFDFAPHDAGCYPRVNGQVYGLDRESGELLLDSQMPVEECGNMLVMTAASAIATGDFSQARDNLPLLRRWVRYLEAYGADPGNQLCTDDFAGHLAHNCNLAIKAIVGIAAFSLILDGLGNAEEAKPFLAAARAMAEDWMRRARNPDGSFRLAFDRPGSFSLKYNAVWDRVFGTGLFPDGTFDAELARYRREALPYGTPLDSRKAYSKSDWIIWAASLADGAEGFAPFAADLLRFYSLTPSRVPMTDWYWCDTGTQVGFQARSVQGGLWMKALCAHGLKPRA